MLDPNSSFRPSPEVVDTTLPNGEVVLLQLGTKRYYTLNPTGARIWQWLAQRRSAGEMSSELQNEFDVSPDLAWQGVSDLLSALAEERLVLPDGAEDPPRPA